MDDATCDFLVIGGGPGGYVAAIRASQLGLNTVLVEQEAVGGTCLNVGCIPSKALIHAAERFHVVVEAAGENPLGIKSSAPQIEFGTTVAWKDGVVGTLTSGVTGLLKRAGVKVVKGRGCFIDGKTVEVDTGAGDKKRISAKSVVIATGSVPIELGALPFGEDVVSSTGALALLEIPDKLVVVGGGYIGLEIGTAYAKLGAKVTVVEAGPALLPQYDTDMVKPIAKRLAALGVTVHLNTLASEYKARAVTVAPQDGAPFDCPADKVLVAVGRRPFTDGLGLEALALSTDNGFLTISDRCETAMRGVYAIGDVTKGPMLAHRAMAQGELVAQIAAGQNKGWDKLAIPATCFTDPEIVTVGLLPAEAKKRFGSLRLGRFPFAANGRALSSDGAEGFIRVVARASDNRILGIQAVGQSISELASAFSIAIEMGARLEDMAAIIQSHPTRSEGLAEAAMQALGQAIHF